MIKYKRLYWKYWLYQESLPKRPLSQSIHLAKANHCILFSKAIEWISGELLGDGCLYSQSKYSALFSYGSKYWEYINYISDTLKSFGIEQSGKIQKCWKGKTHKNGEWVDRPVSLFPYSFFYASKSYEELKPLRNKWYPDNKKIVPKDLKLTPLICKQWYIGDGSLIHPKKGNSYIILYTCGFPINDVEWLVRQLNKLGFKTTREPSHNSIHISTCSTLAFLSYIGKCPCKVYDYKWKLGG